jgi:hypothetical protein
VTGEILKDAFQVIFKSGRRPIRLQTDKGTKYINRVFQKFLKEHDMHFFNTSNERLPLVVNSIDYNASPGKSSSSWFMHSARVVGL